MSDAAHLAGSIVRSKREFRVLAAEKRFSPRPFGAALAGERGNSDAREPGSE
jgi:hypothetical protein